MQRLDFSSASPKAYKAWAALEGYLAECGLEQSLLELVRLRSSQLNGCSYCVDMHSTDLRKAGESERRIWAVAAWREGPFFSPRERAALAWTEAMTKLAQGPALDADYAALSEHFSEREMVDLTVAISTINGWNRLAVGFATQPKL